MIAALLYGPHYEAAEPAPSNIELFDNIGEAIAALFNRHRAHGRAPQGAKYLDGHTEVVLFPTFAVSTYFQCYDVSPDGGWGSPQFSLNLQRAIAAEVVEHEWDYHLSLNDDGYGAYVKVSMA